MRTLIFLCFILIACHKSEGSTNKAKPESQNQAVNTSQQSAVLDLGCDTDVCLKFINHDREKLTFDIYMVNSLPVAGFQCDIPGVKIIDSTGGLLKSLGFDASNNDNRLLAFSMTGKVIAEGQGVLTTVQYENSSAVEICLEGVVFAGKGGSKLSIADISCLDI